MSTSTTSSQAEDQGSQLVHWLLDSMVNGFGILPSAIDIAEDHLKACKGNRAAAIDSVIGWQTAYASGTGFASGLGGIALLPITLPAGLAASYILAVNTIAAIAYLRGYDLQCNQVRTSVLLCLLGDGAIEVLKQGGIKFASKLTQQLIAQIPGKVLIEINKRIGFRLLTKAGEKGIINLMKLVPIAGGLVSAGFDGVFINTSGQAAKKFFPTAS
ncbi:MAG: hypothetical protein EA001_06355 [Oscillatoriales cyanobacterium]|nr:MAG: hypothetical protein EA001_06355 [Oscillatoriales cyanobacterium]